MALWRVWPHILDDRARRRTLRRYYEDAGTWRDTYWLGVPVRKLPLDLWLLQEIIHATRPDLIIESGTFRGGSALYMACMCDLVGAGEVVTVDVVEERGRPEHPRITYLNGSSTDPGIVADLSKRAKLADRVMVVLDADHSERHVSEELHLLAPLVTPGCYLVVEDTIVNGNPVLPGFGAGPAEALARYLADEPGLFEVDSRLPAKTHLTFNPGGYLRRRG